MSRAATSRGSHDRHTGFEYAVHVAGTPERVREAPTGADVTAVCRGTGTSPTGGPVAAGSRCAPTAPASPTRPAGWWRASRRSGWRPPGPRPARRTGPPGPPPRSARRGTSSGRPSPTRDSAARTNGRPSRPAGRAVPPQVAAGDRGGSRHRSPGGCRPADGGARRPVSGGARRSAAAVACPRRSWASGSAQHVHSVRAGAAGGGRRHECEGAGAFSRRSSAWFMARRGVRRRPTRRG